MWLSFYYRLQIRLRERKVFTDICLFIEGWGGDQMYQGILSHGGVPTPGHQMWGPPASDIWWWSLETCSNFWGPPLGVTSGGGYWNWSTYGFQVGGTHPTGMLSCVILCLLQIAHNYWNWHSLSWTLSQKISFFLQDKKEYQIMVHKFLFPLSRKYVVVVVLLDLIVI